MGFVTLEDADSDTKKETDDSVSYSQSPAIGAEELLRRYKAGERNFKGINRQRQVME